MFHFSLVENVLCKCNILWHGTCIATEVMALQRLVKMKTEDCRKMHCLHLWSLHIKMQGGGVLHIVKDSTQLAHSSSLSPQAGGWGAFRARSTGSETVSILHLLENWTWDSLNSPSSSNLITNFIPQTNKQIWNGMIKKNHWVPL